MKLQNIKFLLFPYLSNESLRIEWVKKQLIKIPRDESIIDVGAGERRYKKYCTHLKYISQDFGQYKGEGDRIGLQMGKWDISKVDIISDITKIPVRNSSFDNVLCTEVLEHVSHPDLAIKEISRILRKDGKLILTAPFASQAHFSPHFFSTGFSVNWYRKILIENGLKILRMEANGNFFDYINQELCRLPITLKRYSNLGVMSYLFYVVVSPVVLIIWLISKFSNGSEKQLCFGYHILAAKI